MERDLRTLRRSKLMNYSEFRMMTTALEKYYKDVKIAILTGKRDAKDLDMRPYLYDEGDPYDKPFYGTLLKMLSEVATSKYFDKQHEDLMKIYKWYKANKKLITSPPKIPIPSSEKSERNSDGHDSLDEDEEEEELKELTKVPKLHLRPKTAPAVEGRRGARYVTWNEAQQQNGPKRPFSASKPSKHQRELWSKDSLTRSLRISPYGPHPSDSSFMDHDAVPEYIFRPGTAPPVFRNTKGRVSPEKLKSFILRPANSSSAPYSSPVISPLSSPRDSPVPTSRTKSPLSAHFTPDIVKEPSVKLVSGVVKDRTSHPTIEETDTNSEHDDIHPTVNGTEMEKKSTQRATPKDATPSQLEEILKHQKKEEELLEEQHELLQKKLLHDYDHYIKDLGSAQEKQVDVEIVDGDVNVKKSVATQDSRKIVQPSPVGTYDLSAPEIVPSYSIMYSGPSTANGHSRSQSENGHQWSSTGPARHVRHATVPHTYPQEVIKVDAVLGMITPIGVQMEYDRERMNGQKFSSGLRQPTILVPSSGSTKSTVPTPVSEELVSAPVPSQNHSEVENARYSPPQTFYEQDSTSHETSSVRPSSDTSDNKSVELKFKEPELVPERTPRDYTVHFPQDKSQESAATKTYKTSGLVVPDTIRYQWTDDGFGNRTYLKKLKPTSPRGTRKKLHHAQQVTMPTGSRSLDKRTLASLVVVKHLGDTDRRNIDRTSGPQGGKLIMGPDHESTDYAYNLEYLSFCQPVGPRLGECERPSTVNWYLQGEHGLYREPTRNHTQASDDLKHRRTDIRIAKDYSLMVEGHHFGAADEHKQEEERPAWEQKDLSSPSTISLDSGQSSITSRTKDTLRPSSAARSSSPTSTPRKTIPIPTAGRSSRPSSARSTCSGHAHENTSNFSVRDFKHFCWDDEYLLTDDYMRQREAWAAVNIQRIFRGFIARQYLKDLKMSNFERQRKAAVTLQSNFRGFLARKRAMEQNIQAYTPSSRDLEWARKYKQDLRKRGDARKQKNQYALFMQSREAEKHGQQISQVKAHQHIFDVFHPTPEGPTKAQMKAAAITIQRYFRGWFVRRMLEKSKAKALKRTLSFNKFIKGYQALLHRIQKRYGIKEPTTALEFNELMEYVERLNKYEVAFDKFASDGVLQYNDIKEFFKSVGHMPSQKEIDEAIEIVTKMSAKGRALTKAEAVEVLFQIYVPKGTKMNLADVRKSTWLNPLDDGRDIMQLLSKKDLEQTNLMRCLEVVAGAGRRATIYRTYFAQDPLRRPNKPTRNKGRKNRPQNHRAKPSWPSTPRDPRPRPPNHPGLRRGKSRARDDVEKYW
ncbi:hypothetical protein OS493_023788 [Desmophyllum pertusum]|uniref:Uncharacterized protein n=1 Tax=Desmophyllum pertusum TaxID=174260 RepID=A0A9W9YPY5_9CNID|nr:hypothetical protein OS493_023788 [Desmophyllum pertusum]